ncbi:serine protease, partial [Streptococcus pneumoniae]
MEANMKHLKTFYKKSFQLLVVIVISFFSGALGSFSITQLTQKSSVNNSNNNSTITQTAYKKENST